MITPFSYIKSKLNRITLAYVNQLIVQGYTPTNVEQIALNNFVYNGFAKGWYPYFTTITGRLWLFIGNASNPCRVDLITASQKGTFNVAPTFSSNGVSFNGTSQYMNLGYDSSVLTERNVLIGWHRRNTITKTGVSLGTSPLQMFPRSSGTGINLAAFSTTGLGAQNTKGIYAMKTRLSDNVLVMYRDLFTQTDSAPATVTTNGALSSLTFNFGARGVSGTPSNFVDEQSDLLFVCQNMPENIYRDFVNDFQTLNYALGRGVATTNRITYEGNSFFSAYPIPSKIDTYLAAVPLTYGSSNKAIASSSLSSIAIVFSDPYMSSSARLQAVNLRRDIDATKDVLCSFEGINELYYHTNNSETVANAVANTYQAYVDYYSYYSGYASLGFTCILNTLTPRNNAPITANYEIARQNASNKLDITTINGLLRSEFTVATSVTRVFLSSNPKWKNCILVDVGDDPNFGQAGQYSNATYYQADLVHPATQMQDDMTNNYYGPAIRYLI